MIDECGLPAEWLHVVTGGGSTVGNALVEHDGVALITFTGSPDVGWAIRAKAPRKKVGLELGNNAPAIIEADSDWRSAATKIKTAGFSHAGQSCISTQRILVHADIAEEFVDALVKEVSSLVVGDPLDEGTDVSALISEGERDRVTAWIDEAVAGGATVAYGGEIDERGVLGPTVLTDVTPDMKVCSQEIFGPSSPSPATPTSTRRCGWPTTRGTACRRPSSRTTSPMPCVAFQTLDFGGVLVNEVPTWRADQQPYGGVRDSGNTREGPAYSVREMTELRMVILSP